jgi:hypothetical protein
MNYPVKYISNTPPVVIKGMDVNKHECLSNITPL